MTSRQRCVAQQITTTKISQFLTPHKPNMRSCIIKSFEKAAGQMSLQQFQKLHTNDLNLASKVKV